MNGIQLVLLRCPVCAAPINGEGEGIFLHCANCAKGFERCGEELSEVAVYFARKSPSAKTFHPFWAFDAALNLRNRDASVTFKSFFSSSNGLVKLFEERTHLRFYVPAFFDDLSAEKPIGLQLTLEQPQLEFLHRGPKVANFSVSQDDARKIADFLFLTSEIQQSDTLRTIQYNLLLTNPIVIVIAI